MVKEMKTAKGKLNEVLVVKLQRGDELTSGIRKACIEHGVTSGVILSMVGSLFNIHCINPITDSSKKCGVGDVDLKFDEPVELMTGQGEICQKENGELLVHIHATIADSQGNAYGGHLVGEDNMVLNTINAFIGIIDGVDMGIEWDETIGLMQFSPKTI